MQGPSSFVIIEAQTIVINGVTPNSGLFEYSGTGAFGNPPQFAVVSPGVTTDPFGNPIGNSKILIQGNVITMTSGIFRTNATAPLIQLDGPHDCVFIYDASANLVISLNPLPTNTNDGLGHTVYPGLVDYAAGLAQIVQLSSGTIAWGTTAQFNGTGGAVVATAQLDLGATSPAGSLIIAGGLATSSDVQGEVELMSKAANATTQAVFSINNTVIRLGAVTAVQDTEAIFWSDTNGYARTMSARTGDAQSYIMGKICTFNPNDQLINSLTFATILNSLTAIGAGKYRFTARMTVTQGPNAIANGFRVGWTGTITQMRARLRQIQDNTSGFLATATSNNGLLASHAFGGATTYDAELTGIIVTTSTGNISIQAACQTSAANTFTVLAASDFLLEPIG